MSDAGLRFKEAVFAFKARYLCRALELFDGDKDKTAKALGMHTDALGKKLKKYKVTRAKATRNGSKSKPKYAA